jgi:hypothetical protein
MSGNNYQTMLQECRDMETSALNLPGCVCAYAFETIFEEKEAEERRINRMVQQKAEFDQKIRTWQGTVNTWIKAKIDEAKKGFVFHQNENKSGWNLNDEGMRDECDNWKKTINCGTYMKVSDDGCGRPSDSGRVHITTSCVPDLDSIAKGAKEKFGASTQLELEALNIAGKLDNAHPAYIERYLLSIKNYSALRYPLIAVIKIMGNLDFTVISEEARKLELGVELNNYLPIESAPFMCCSNSINCDSTDGGCNEGTFNNIVQSCNQEYSTVVDTNESIKIETVIELPDENIYTTYIEDNFTLVVIGVIVGVVILGIVIALVVIQYTLPSTQPSSAQPFYEQPISAQPFYEQPISAQPFYEQPIYAQSFEA